MLTTRCPHCGTVFRIRPEQLSVRGGRVRCGHCQQAFSALAQLEDYDEEDASAIMAQQRPATPPAQATPPRPAAVSRPLAPPPPPPPAARPTPIPAPAAVRPTPAPIIPPRPAAAPPAPAPRPVPAPQPVARPPMPVEQQPLMPPTLPPRATPVAAPAKPPVRPQPAAPRPVSMGEMPVPDLAQDPTKTQPLASWDQFELPVDIEDLEEEAPDFIAEKPAGAAPASAPDSDLQGFSARSSADDFSMHIEMDSRDDDTPPPAPVEPKIEPTVHAAPFRSEIAHQLGIPTYDPDAERVYDQTIMLEEPVDLVGFSEMEMGPDSLFEERERQRQASAKGVEDRRKHHSLSLWGWSAGALLMLVITILALSFLFRTDLARVAPGLRPPLESACARIGCTVPYPQDSELIDIENGNTLAPDPKADGKYRFVVTLRNSAAYAQAWPHMALVIMDQYDIAVSRRTLAPAEWLPPGYASQPAFEGHSEVTANLSLKLNDVQAAGYRIHVFYP